MKWGNLTGHEFVTVHIKIFFHPTEECIVDIRLVNVLQEVTDRGKGEHKCINFEKKPSLIRRQLPRIPNVSFPCLERLDDNIVLRGPRCFGV